MKTWYQISISNVDGTGNYATFDTMEECLSYLKEHDHEGAEFGVVKCEEYTDKFRELFNYGI